MSACEIDSALCEIKDIGDTNNKNNRAIRYRYAFSEKQLICCSGYGETYGSRISGYLAVGHGDR